LSEGHFGAIPDFDLYTGSCEVSMAIHSTRFYALELPCFVLLLLMLAGALRELEAQENSRQNAVPHTVAPGAEYSGMYSFLKEGEFVQVTVEEKGRVTGFVSRYGDSESDRGVFLDQFFKTGKIDGNQLSFTTDIVHGVSFEFRGTVDRGAGKKAGDEAYYVLKGTLVENTMDDAKKTSSHSREVALRSFPQDMSSPEAERK
jgi:hypothetical protein